MKLDRFQKILLVTIVSTIILICIGTLVRATGAGLGCPDWPKCWGKWLPPSSVEEVDFAKLPRDKFPHATPADFNITKMWIEYSNRLFGVAVGILILITCWMAYRRREKSAQLFRWSWIAVITVILQGLLGAVVVRTGLKQGTVTLHLLGAFALLCVLLFMFWLTVSEGRPRTAFRHRKLLWLLFAATSIQMILGAEVRARIEEIGGKVSGASGFDIIAQVGWFDHIHRAFSWVVLLLAIFLLIRSAKLGFSVPVVLSRVILGLVGAQMVFGIVLAYGGLPAPFKILHLGVATLMISAEFLFLLETSGQRARARTDEERSIPASSS
jgi:cytochrome c oxidase assembly protein subunit 15